MTSTVNTIRRISALLVLIILLAGSAAAEVEVAPSTLNDSVTVGENHSYEFTFTNTDPNQSVRNVTVEDTEWLDWSRNSFDLNESSSTSVNASIQVQQPGQFNETLSTSYRAWNESNSTENETNSSGNWIDREGPDIDVLLDSDWPSTDVEVDVFQSEFEFQFGEGDNSVIGVQNNGNNTARNVTLSGQNIQFAESGVEIPADDDRIFEFNVYLPLPEENATAATNQTYTRTLVVSGENFESRSVNVSIFVPYKDYNEDQVTEEERLRELYFEVCGDGSSDNLICRGTVVDTETETKYINRTPESNVTLSDPELRAIKQYADQSPQRFTNLSHTVAEQQNLTRQEISRLVEELEEEQEEDEQLREYVREQERSDQRTNLFIALLFLLAGFIGAGVGVFKIAVKASNDTRI